MKEVLKVNVIVDQSLQVKGSKKDVNMVLFHGDAYSEYFEGNVLPGGVDTQVCDESGRLSLSARYILKGKDMEHNDCCIFIENEGIMKQDGGVIKTTPNIITDSKCLKWMESASLTGTVEITEKDIVIRIFHGDSDTNMRQEDMI